MSNASAPMFIIGRILFGVSILGFGVLCGVYQDFLPALQPVPASWPGARTLAFSTAVMLAGTGIALATHRKVGQAATVLALLLGSWILLLHLPRIVVGMFTAEWWTATFGTTALFGVALVLVGCAKSGEGKWWREAGALVFGVSLSVFGAQHLMYADQVAALVPAWIPFSMFWAYFTGIAQVAAGIAILAAVAARPAALLAGVMYGAWAIVLHLPRVLNASGTFTAQVEWTCFLKAVAFCGAAWLVAYAQPAPPKRQQDEVEFPRFNHRFG